MLRRRPETPPKIPINDTIDAGRGWHGFILALAVLAVILTVAVVWQRL